MQHIVQMSGGLGSWATAQRVAERHGTQDLILLFADVKSEDQDLYRFLDQAVEQLEVPLIRVADGRDPWELFEDKKFIGNARIAPCSYYLKILPCKRWLKQHADPADTVLYVGIDAGEPKRAPGIARMWQPWQVEFPMLEEPYLTKDDMAAWSSSLGIAPPRLYGAPFFNVHNNCGGFCVRAGQRQWRRMLEVDPEGFARIEAWEERMREQLGDVSILRERVRGVSRPLPLAELRRRHELAVKGPAAG